jgi:MFS family permease
MLGVGNGYIAILLFTWMQTHAPKEMLGRVMSLLMFSNTGLAPVSQAVSGFLCRGNPAVMFVIAGALVLAVALGMASRPELKAFGESLGAKPHEEPLEGRWVSESI